MKIVPLELRELNDLVTRLHRHHKPVQGHRFSLGLMLGDTLIGGCSVGRPVARMICQKTVVEVTRLVTDGTKNACSMLYSAAARVAKAMGYKAIQTYILDEEMGTSLRASGWEYVGVSPGGSWTRKTKPNRREDQPLGRKKKFVKVLLKGKKS